MVDDKAPRVANFHRNTLRALAELLGAAGLAHPSDIKPWHMHARGESGAILRGDEFYPRVPPGALLDGEVNAELAREWRLAQAESFEPTPF